MNKSERVHSKGHPKAVLANHNIIPEYIAKFRVSEMKLLKFYCYSHQNFKQ